MLFPLSSINNEKINSIFFAFFSAACNAEVVICPEKITLKPSPLITEERLNGFQVMIIENVVYLESAGLYIGPPFLLAQQVPKVSPAPGVMLGWDLFPPTKDVLDQDDRFDAFWVSCAYGGGLIEVSKKLDNPGLKRCFLKDLDPKARRRKVGRKLGFFCE